MIKSLQKKGFAFLLIALFIFSTFLPIIASASPNDVLDIKGESALLIDAASGKILYQKNPDMLLPPASMTKMMTEYLLLEAIKNGKITWDQKTAISEYAYKVSQNINLSNVPLRKDGQYSVKELYESMAIYSANGSTIVLAELMGGSETNFIKTMAEKAVQLGLKDFKFVNCTGLNNNDLYGMQPQGTGLTEENMMSARAVGVLAFNLLRDYPDLLATSSIPHKIFREGTKDAIKMDNWNWMLPTLVYGYQGIDGLKTGSTDLGGFSFTATALRNNMRLISIVMKTSSYAARFGETKKILDYGFSTFSTKEFNADTKEFPVVMGKENKINLVPQKPLKIVIKNGEENQYELDYKINDSLAKDGKLIAPIAKGQAVGYLTFNYKGSTQYSYLLDDNKKYERVDLLTAGEVKKTNWFILSMRFIGEFFLKIFKK